MVGKCPPAIPSLGSKTGPDWLEPLITTSYFGPCELHTAESCSAASHKNECNMFCMECASVGERYSLCTLCVAEHPSHNIIQIRRSSYHDCIRVNEIQRLVDLYNIQTYIINGNKIVFLADRPQLKSTKGQIHLCETCDRVLNDPMRFCSLGCKLAGIEKDPEGDTLTMCPRYQSGLLPADSEDSQGSRKKYALDKQLKRQLSTLSRQSSPPLPALREVGAPNSDNESPYRPFKSYRKVLTASEERRLDESANPFRSQHRELVKQLSEAFNSGGFLKKKRRAAAQLSRAPSPVRLATPSSSTSLTPPSTPPSCAQSCRASFGNKRRKGIPHRAPVC
eukprot:TRINITY_DN6264_c0_g1_i1.p1 TRINITY_DN6264_c0_g1~~TRINITY_DN6264_c0_g1_i1.p1  ORF type:complete len:336 (-),score=54.92 TRINITY_DN6264_c0_g1_i1:453-1460(-)